MSSKWPTTNLGAICKFTAGSAFKPEFQGCSAGDYPFIKVSDMNAAGNEIFINSASNYVNEIQRAAMKAKLHPVGAIVFAKIGVALTTNRRRLLTRPTIIDNNMMSATPRNGRVTSRFLYLLLTSIDFNTISAGTALPYLNVSDLERIEVSIPDTLSEQEAIARTLGDIDDKIDLNRRINQTLEAMAQAIFKSWFVDFDPVKAKISAIEQDEDPLRAAMRAISGLSACGAQAGKTDAELDQMPREYHNQLATTAALFPDAMEESELGEIPKGWEVVSLYETANYLNGAAFRASDFSGAAEALPIIKIAELKQGVNSGTKRTLKEIDPKYQIKSGDVLYSWSGSPDTSLEVFRWFGVTGLLNQHIFKLSFSHAGQREYTYYLLKEIKPILVATAKQKQTTGLGHITVADMKRIKVARPKVSDLKNFTQQLKRIYAATSECEQQAMTLAALRDTLLPKLLSGELSVADVEIPA